MKRDELELLNNAKNLLKEEVAPISYTTWIAPLEIEEMTDKKIIFLVGTEFQKDVLQKKYLQLIKNTFSYLTNKEYEILVHCTEETGGVSTITTKSPQNSSSGLNPNYTFDSYVVGSNNRFAQAAALAVAEAPATSYNPLFLYGGVGLGKTHLMQAIGNQILQEFSDKKVLYVTSEKFTNDFINCIKDNKNEEFRNKYRNIDALLIDDIQFIAGKKQVQEEFFHTFNTLHEESKQIIISSDRPPKEIPTLEDRLRSRFEWGLITDITPPDLETRIAILRKKAKAEGLDIPNEVMLYIANQIDSNIRELEGALIRVVAYSSLINKDINADLAAEALKNIIPSSKPKIITILDIQRTVGQHFNVKLEDFKAKKRTKSVAFPRQIAMYLSRELTDFSLPKIGEEFGGRDHTTVIHAHEKISKLLSTDTVLQKQLRTIHEELKM